MPGTMPGRLLGDPAHAEGASPGRRTPPGAHAPGRRAPRCGTPPACSPRAAGPSALRQPLDEITGQHGGRLAAPRCAAAASSRSSRARRSARARSAPAARPGRRDRPDRAGCGRCRPGATTCGSRVRHRDRPAVVAGQVDGAARTDRTAVELVAVAVGIEAEPGRRPTSTRPTGPSMSPSAATQRGAAGGLVGLREAREHRLAASGRRPPGSPRRNSSGPAGSAADRKAIAPKSSIGLPPAGGQAREESRTRSSSGHGGRRAPRRAGTHRGRRGLGEARGSSRAIRLRSSSAMQAGSQGGSRRPRAPHRAGRLAGGPRRGRGAAAVAGRRSGSCTCRRRSRCTCRRSGCTPGAATWCCWCVDPARLTDPVRFEDGVPADPGGMLFPHLYGPLPVSAVIAVVPYRPPAPLAAARAGRPARPRPGVLDRRCRSAGPWAWATSRAASRCSTRTSRTPTTTTGWSSPTPVDADTVERRPRRSAATPGGRTGRPRCCGPAPTTSPPNWAAAAGHTEELLLMGRPAAADRRGGPRRGGRRARGARVLGRGPGGATCPIGPRPGPGGRPTSSAAST